jgi:hypothetical protein
MAVDSKQERLACLTRRGEYAIGIGDRPKRCFWENKSIKEGK